MTNSLKRFLGLTARITLACLTVVQGQYGTKNTYSSGTYASATSQYVPYVQVSPWQSTQVIGYLDGTVLNIRDENSMYVNFTDSKIPGMEGPTLILLPRPVPFEELMHFTGKELSFNLLGHDILGRPVCDAYFQGVSIDHYWKERKWHDYTSYSYGYYPDKYIGDIWYYYDSYPWLSVP